MKNFSFSVTEQKGRIAEISLQKKPKKTETPLEKKCRKEITEYLEGKRKEFSIPLIIEGTEFELKVWKEMAKIPYGQTRTYKEISERIKMPQAYRAVANVCGKNKLPIILPCHRVVAVNGIGGYTPGIEIKKILLSIENKK